MKPIYFTLSLVLLSLLSFAQREKKEYYKSNFEEGYLVTIYDKYGEVVREYQTGEWKLYHMAEDKRIKAQGEYDNGLKKGRWTFYDKEGNIEEEGSFKKNLRTGYWKAYGNKMLSSEGRYEDDKEQGTWKYYYSDNGKLYVQGDYENGLKTGRWKWFFSNGAVMEEGDYKNNERVGVWANYTDKGLKVSEVNYEKGIRTIYHKEGNIFQQMEFTLGEGDKIYMKNFVMYYSNGNKRLEGEFDASTSCIGLNGYYGWFKLKGIWKSYWENGKQAVEYNFIEGLNKVINTEFADNHKYDTKSGGTGRGEKVLMELDYKSHNGSLWTSFSGLYSASSTYKNPKYNISSRQTLANSMLLYSNGGFNRSGVWDYINNEGVLESKINYSWITNQPEGMAEFYYPNGQLQCEGEFDKKNKRTGTWKFYFENGKLKKEETYENGKLNGIVNEYFENGKLKNKAAYVDGKLVGVKELYHPNGKILGKENYNNNSFVSNGDFFDENGNITLQNGTGYRVDYFANGKLSFKGNYRNGKMDGINTWYFENGKIKSEFNYSNGTYSGEYKIYFQNGGIKEKGFYNNEKINGTVEFYHPNGKLLGSSKYSNGNFVAPNDYFDENGKAVLSNGSGVYTEYYSSGKVSARINYLNYCRSGKAQWYHDNGQLEQEAIYKYNEAQKPQGLRWEIVSSFDKNGNEREKGTLKDGNGTWISYDADGKKTVTEYENGIKK